MTTTLIFLGGAGSGAFVACLLILSAMRHMSRGATERDQRTIEYNKQSIDALEARNAIGERQATALEKIAATAE